MSTPPPHWYFQGREDEDRDRLTFGVELEFGLALIPQDQDHDPDDDDPRPGRGIALGIRPDEFWLNARHHLVETLQKAGIAAEASLDSWTTKSSTPKNPHAWGIKEDDTIKISGQGYHYVAVEIMSPAFYFSPEALQEVQYVCITLGNSYSLNCSHTCALQVHVGKAKKGLSYETAQKLMATYFAFEPQLEQIHPPRRHDNEHCPKVRKSAMMKERFQGRFRTIREGLGRIFKGQKNNLQELYEDTSPLGMNRYRERRRSAMAIGKLLSYDDDKTVEFRQHEMTLSAARVDHWICLCVGLVEFSDTIDRELLENFLNVVVDLKEEVFPLQEVLETIGLPREAEFYSARLAREALSLREVLGTIGLPREADFYSSERSRVQ